MNVLFSTGRGCFVAEQEFNVGKCFLLLTEPRKHHYWQVPVNQELQWFKIVDQI